MYDLWIIRFYLGEDVQQPILFQIYISKNKILRQLNSRVLNAVKTDGTLLFCKIKYSRVISFSYNLLNINK